MTDQTKCPHCGADVIARSLYRSVYQCGSRDLPERFEQSTVCEVWQLRAKVAAQQELLKEADEALRTLHHWSDVATHMGHATLIACRENAAEVLAKLDAAK